MSAPPIWADIAWRLAWLQAVAAYGFTGRQTDVAVMYFNLFNGVEGGAWPGLEWLADALNIERRNLRRLIDDLESAGFLTKVREGGGLQSSMYVPRLPPGLVIVDRAKGHTNVHLATLNPAFKPKVANGRKDARLPKNNKWGLRSPHPGGAYAPTPGAQEPPPPGAHAPPESTKEPTSEPPNGVHYRDSSRGDPMDGEGGCLPAYPPNATRLLKGRYPQRLKHLKAASVDESILAFRGLELHWAELLEVLDEALPRRTEKVWNLFANFEGNARVAISRREHASKAEAEWVASQASEPASRSHAGPCEPAGGPSNACEQRSAA